MCVCVFVCVCVTNYDNFTKIRRTTENSTGLQFDPPGNVINLNSGYFTKDVYKLLSKILDFVQTIKK